MTDQRSLPCLTSRLFGTMMLVLCLLIVGIVALPTVPGFDREALASQGAGSHAGAQRAIDRQTSRGSVVIAPTHTDINETLGLLRSELRQIHVPAFPQDHQPVMLETLLNDEPITLELWPHAIVAPDFRVRAQIDTGELIEVEVGPQRTLRGHVVEVPGSSVAASFTEEGVRAMLLMPDGERYWIQPVQPYLPVADATLHVVYRTDDALPQGICGVGNTMQPFADGEEHPVGGLAEGDADGGLAGSSVSCVKLGVDADFQYYQQHGSNETQVTNAIMSIVNSSNVQYANQTGIEHQVTEIIIRTSSASNPYTTNNASSLLSQFRNTWNTFPEFAIDRNVAHLFTGRNLSGSTIGVAYLNTMCQKNWAYGLSQNVSSFSSKTDLFAHELGHNWNASHCTCPGFTMNPSLTSANQFNTFSINQITAKKNSVSCPVLCGELEPPGPQPPSNNTCQNSKAISNGLHLFTNELATTNGPDEPQLCDFDGESTIESDVWFRYTATCTGELTVSFCDEPEGISGGTEFETKIALYGTTCPSLPGTAIACNKTSCQDQSSVSIPVNLGQVVRIRIGGHNGQQGEGAFTVACASVPVPIDCPGDIDSDGMVDGFDLLLLLSNWGPAADGSPADLNSDGEVNGFDLLGLLSNWGTCE